jgi:hypothetical protein
MLLQIILLKKIQRGFKKLDEREMLNSMDL